MKSISHVRYLFEVSWLFSCLVFILPPSYSCKPEDFWFVAVRDLAQLSIYLPNIGDTQKYLAHNALQYVEHISQVS